MSAVESTALYKLLQERHQGNIISAEDFFTVKSACDDAEELLKKVADTFPTYTLHDATHSVNVCEIIYKLSDWVVAHNKRAYGLRGACCGVADGRHV